MLWVVHCQRSRSAKPTRVTITTRQAFSLGEGRRGRMGWQYSVPDALFHVILIYIWHSSRNRYCSIGCKHDITSLNHVPGGQRENPRKNWDQWRTRLRWQGGVPFIEWTQYANGHKFHSHLDTRPLTYILEQTQNRANWVFAWSNASKVGNWKFQSSRREGTLNFLTLCWPLALRWDKWRRKPWGFLSLRCGAGKINKMQMWREIDPLLAVRVCDHSLYPSCCFNVPKGKIAFGQNDSHWYGL